MKTEIMAISKFNEFDNIERIIFVACGTAFYAWQANGLIPLSIVRQLLASTVLLATTAGRALQPRYHAPAARTRTPHAPS